MKTSYSVYLRVFLLTSILALPALVWADRYATLTSGGSLTLAEGETALVIFSYAGNNRESIITYAPASGGSAQINIPGAVTSTTSPAITGSGPTSENPIPLAGPATITVGTSIYATYFLGIRITSTEIPATSGGGDGQQSAEGTPSNSVVIPEDSTGPIEIILESSIDLVTWTAANPGTYGSSTEKRFFRVRAVENPAP